MKKLIYFLFLTSFIFILASCSNSKLPNPEDATIVINKEEMNEFIKSSIISSGELFDWNKQSADIIWNATLLSENQLMIGFESTNVIDDVLKNI